MKAYLSISGTIFGLFALWHIFELIYNWRTLTIDRWYMYGVSAIIVASGLLCIWAWILLKLHRRAATKSTEAESTLR